MFQQKMMAGRRILVTRGGTGLGKAMAEVRSAQFSDRRIDTFGIDTRIAQHQRDKAER